MTGRRWLVIAGWGSLAAAAAHVSAILGGPKVYSFLGAPNYFVRWVEEGRMMPHLITFGIATILVGWAAFAFSGAGKLWRLPLLRTGLVLITGFCLGRSTAMFTPYFWLPEHSQTFRIVSSVIVLILGLFFFFGTRGVWNELSKR
jgi:hypothetical protein